MIYILTIETSTKVCSVAIHRNGELLAVKESKVPNSHSEFLNMYIQNALEDAEINLKQLNAICISSGPGSYTGLRIGLSTAKGLCFALDIPLISIDSLTGLALKVIENESSIHSYDILCPMIDARRMEVYCSSFNTSGNVITEPSAKIIDEYSFNETLNTSKMLFFGDGSSKCKSVLTHQNTHFLDDVLPSAASFGNLAYQKYNAKLIEDVAYFEPFYLKEFYTVPSKKNLLFKK